MSYVYNQYIYFDATKDSYNDAPDLSKLPPGWEVIEMPRNIPMEDQVGYDPMTGTEYKYQSSNGYFGRAYYNPSSGDVVVAHRGSDELKDWTGPDLNIAMGKWHPQFDSGHKFDQYVKEYLNKEHPGVEFRTVQTGHSLGGAIAQVEGARNKEYAVSYDNPGVSALIKDRLGIDALESSKNNVEILSHPNLINDTGRHHGNVFHQEWKDNKEYADRINDFIAKGGDPSVALSVPIKDLMGHKIESIDKHLDPATGMPYPENVKKGENPVDIDKLLNPNSTRNSDDPLLKEILKDRSNEKPEVKAVPLAGNSNIFSNSSASADNYGLGSKQSMAGGTSGGNTNHFEGFHFEQYYSSIESGLQKLTQNLHA